jgi:hypothetical protein
LLVREEDVSGVSGTGIVAEGIQFSTGNVCVVFTTRGVSGVNVFGSLPDAMDIHGHEGKTKVQWLDE